MCFGFLGYIKSRLMDFPCGNLDLSTLCHSASLLSKGQNKINGCLRCLPASWRAIPEP